jgi:hypothetical protein
MIFSGLISKLFTVNKNDSYLLLLIKERLKKISKNSSIAERLGIRGL